ncbi:M56 family metallopeptidase [Paenibacillus radicis (ex Xue et al. 2023)]|uniref:M56 family metallopeptidase n=1 Tax=Paenibacillus radicis (ex Xue et al. 2023) TaxID=2972489 RepID=A0ABT1YHH7_9BACL|nr:M56 family metallopeptidase [Paenibacillus radicis (ex Xue et al. 2023)]MCR8632646.1 M56 family metallopeptidase [Paenibacillus radicis (ex Xue et al. 2023)]
MIFITCSLFSCVLLLQMGLYMVHVIMDWRMGYNIIELCHTLLQAYGLNFAGYALQAIVYQTFFLFVFTIIRQAYLSIRFASKIAVCRNQLLSREMNRKYGTGKEEISVINSSTPIALATGFFKRRIVLSTGLLKLLSKNELRAVLYHESFHARSSDPLKTFMLSLFATALWYIPILKWFQRNYNIVREVLADQYAIHRMGTSAELGSALLKLLRGGIPARMPVSHVSITDASINYRIQQILEPERKLELKWPMAPLMISIQVVALLSVMFMILMR